MRKMPRNILFVLVIFMVILSSVYDNNIAICSNKFKKKFVVFDSATGNLYKTKSNQVIQLAGTYDGDKMHAKIICLKIKDKKTNKNLFTKYIQEGKGWQSSGLPELFVGDFNGDKRSDIFIRIHHGGNLLIFDYYLYTFKGNRIEKVSMDSLENFDKINFQIENNKLKVKSKDLNKTLYKTIGKETVKYFRDHKVKLEVNEFPNSLELLDWDKDGVSEVRDEIYIRNGQLGCFFGILEVVYKYKNNKWRTVEFKFIKNKV